MKKTYNKGGLLTVLGENKEEQYKRDTRGRPKTNFKEIKNESERGTLSGETRATFIVKEEHLTKLKQIAYWNRKQLKQVIAEALLESITKYEKKNGTLKKIPQ